MQESLLAIGRPLGELTNKVHERLSGVSRMQESLLAIGRPLGELTNKVHERLSGVSRMQERLLDDPTGGAYSLLPSSCGVWGSLQCSPDPIAGGEEAGCPLSKNPITAVSHVGLGLRPIGPRP